MKKTIALLICCTFFSGCSMLNMFASTEVHVSPEIIEAVNEAKTFIGKTKQEIRTQYGKPMSITHDVSYHDGVTYDERWLYRYDAGIPIIAPNQYAITFYFIGDVVRLVTG